MRKSYLLTPGPTPLPPQVLEAMARPIILGVQGHAAAIVSQWRQMKKRDESGTGSGIILHLPAHEDVGHQLLPGPPAGSAPHGLLDVLSYLDEGVRGATADVEHDLVDHDEGSPVVDDLAPPGNPLDRHGAAYRALLGRFLISAIRASISARFARWAPVHRSDLMTSATNWACGTQ